MENPILKIVIYILIFCFDVFLFWVWWFTILTEDNYIKTIKNLKIYCGFSIVFVVGIILFKLYSVNSENILKDGRFIFCLSLMGLILFFNMFFIPKNYKYLIHKQTENQNKEKHIFYIAYPIFLFGLATICMIYIH
jgi:hypothetical protein